jgi:hypothetical protein
MTGRGADAPEGSAQHADVAGTHLAAHLLDLRQRGRP